MCGNLAQTALFHFSDISAFLSRGKKTHNCYLAMLSINLAQALPPCLFFASSATNWTNSAWHPWADHTWTTDPIAGFSTLQVTEYFVPICCIEYRVERSYNNTHELHKIEESKNANKWGAQSQKERKNKTWK